MHRKTPTDTWAKHIGHSLASRCPNCLSAEKDDQHLFFSCSFAHQFWCWLFSSNGVRLLLSRSAPAPLLWFLVAKDRDASGRKSSAAILFHAISVLWTIRNEAKHLNKSPSLNRAKRFLVDRLKDLATSHFGTNHPLPCHPILLSLGLNCWSFNFSSWLPSLLWQCIAAVSWSLGNLTFLHSASGTYLGLAAKSCFGS